MSVKIKWNSGSFEKAIMKSVNKSLQNKELNVHCPKCNNQVIGIANQITVCPFCNHNFQIELKF